MKFPTPHLATLAGWLLVVAGWQTQAAAQTPDGAILVDVRTSWNKRDEMGCRSRARLSAVSDAAIVTGDTTGVLFWRVPTRDGRSLTLSPIPKWIQECKRAPLEFGATMLEQARKKKILIDVGEHRLITWRWRVSRTVSTRPNTPRERLTTARLGLNVLNRSGELREIGYVWTKAAPVDSVLVHRTSHAGGMVKRDWHRIVVRNEGATDEWFEESRDVRADFKRLFPKEEPGYVVRLYVRADGDAAGPVTASFASIIFVDDP